MIRHYEKTKLLQVSERNAAGYRQFKQHDIAILKFIRQARLLGFSIAQINELLFLWQDPQRASSKVKQLAKQHLHDMQHKMQELAEMQVTLQTMIDACPGDDNADCAILEGLSGDTDEQSI